MTIPKGTQMVYITFSAEITAQSSEKFINILIECIKSGVKDVYLLLFSAGGAVPNTVGLYNLLRGLPLKLTTHNIGNVDSAANILYLAGSPRYASETARFMLHNLSLSFNTGCTFKSEDMRDNLNRILSDHGRFLAIVCDRTGIVPDECEAMFSQADALTARHALDRGFADDIREPRIPEGSIIFHIG